MAYIVLSCVRSLLRLNNTCGNKVNRPFCFDVILLRDSVKKRIRRENSTQHPRRASSSNTSQMIYGICTFFRDSQQKSCKNQPILKPTNSPDFRHYLISGHISHARHHIPHIYRQTFRRISTFEISNAP